jgi:toxin ParE1/3/4
VSRLPVSLHPAALAEAEAAIGWYRERSERAAQRFLDELDRVIHKIAEVPRRFPQFELGTTRFIMRRFPYFIVFRESDSAIEIVAVAHGRRRPGYWKDRVQ